MKAKPHFALDITETRHQTHGSFQQNAQVSQGLKAVMKSVSGWEALGDQQREALEMIALKISRILSGKGGHKDHWDDIEGYARLGGRCCK